MGINNFDVLKRMSAENKRIWLAPTVTDMNYSANKGTKVTFGIEGNVVFDIQHGKKNAVCLLWSVDEFNAMKAEMDKQGDMLSDSVADKVAAKMGATELGLRYGEQAMRDICRAFACNLRRLEEGKWKLED